MHIFIYSETIHGCQNSPPLDICLLCDTVSRESKKTATGKNNISDLHLTSWYIQVGLQERAVDE